MCKPTKLWGAERTGMSARYCLEGSGFEPRWRQDIFSSPDRPRGPLVPFYNRYRVSFPGITGQGVTFYPHLVPRLRMSTLLSLCSCMRATTNSFSHAKTDINALQFSTSSPSGYEENEIQDSRVWGLIEDLQDMLCAIHAAGAWRWPLTPF